MGIILSVLWKGVRQCFGTAPVQFNYQGFVCLGRFDDASGQFVATVCHPNLAAVLWADSLHELETTFCELIDQHLAGGQYSV